MITIEFSEPNNSVCECCGEKSTSLTRFVSKNDDAHAVYYCKFTLNHNDKEVYGVVSLGEWGEGSKPEDRVAFPFVIWTNASHFQVGLIDKNESPWNDVELLGEMLDREQSLKHPWKDEVFHITDHIVAEDKEVIEFLEDNARLNSIL